LTRPQKITFAELRRSGVQGLLIFAGVLSLLMMVLTHVAEHWHIFPSMGWGLQDSPGHYLDLTSAILGVAFLLAALLWKAWG
jgi:multisubunit Na+/H+ antiporter MnhB subunit